jgi:thioredoxin reductase (NADPH)
MSPEDRGDVFPGSSATPDPNVPREQVLPKLSAEQIARISPFGRERRLRDGELLWEVGATNISFFVILDGSISILAGTVEHIIAVVEQGEFTGSLDMLSGRRVSASARARARGATRVLEIERDRLHAFVQTDVELGEIFLRTFILRRGTLIASGEGDVVLIGSRHSAGTLRLQEFLTRNYRPYTYIDVHRDPMIQKALDTFQVGIDDVPVVICRGVRVLKMPTIEELAECLGLNCLDESKVRDLVVVGAGPAGLAAAVYASSEGLEVLVLEAFAPGGQAAASSRIENYLGFPTGISGKDLAAHAFVQAEKFGAEVVVARTATRLACDHPPYRIELASGAAVQARAVVIATGVEYRKPDIANLSRFEGVGIYYAATPLEAKVCDEEEEVIVVGGGNSAGQATVFLASSVRRVHMLVRGPGLAESMSRYLIRRIEETPNIVLRTHAQIEAIEGTSRLERVTWLDSAHNSRTSVDVRHVFLMTGADPNTRWLEQCVVLDGKGFIKTGADFNAEELRTANWPLARLPFLFETSLPGVFAVGDARANSTKRVAAAVGEGSVCVQLVHRVLAE